VSGAKGPAPDLPGFTFTESIGGGGFADVFLFTQHSTGRPVAVKVLRAEHLSAASLGQFQVEANVMAGVSAHPYIVTIHDAGVAPDGRPYIVMEHYPQPHFGIRSRGGRLGVAEVLKLAVQIACAVETAHRASILHRDIKPANVLTSAFGDPGLTDFGIAGVQADDGVTAAGGVSLGFAAPEVVLDEHATGSVSSDVYSLAATVYALLTGHSPVFVPGGDNSPGVITQRIAQGTTVPLTRADVPRSFQHLLNAALAADPAHRPDRAVSFAQAVQDVEQELRLPATPLVLVGPSSPAARIERSADDDEGTRRKPRVVSVDGAPAPASSTPASPPAFVPPVRPAELDPPTAPRDDRFAGAPIGETVARGGPAPEPVPLTESDRPTAATRGEPRPRWIIYAAVAAGIVVLGVGGLIVSLGGGDGSEASVSTTGPVVSQDPTAGAAYVSEPTDVTATLTPNGRVEVSWSPPAEIDSTGDLIYRVRRTEEGLTDLVVDDITDTSVVISGDQRNEEDTVCVVVEAMLDSVISEPSTEACTAG